MQRFTIWRDVKVRIGDALVGLIQFGTTTWIRLMARLPFGLTQKEAEVLRLVDRTRTTGEIAALVGRSASTVDHQIKSARARMGNISRFSAAERFREAEMDSQSASRPSQAISVEHSKLDQGCATDEWPAERSAERVAEVPHALLDPLTIKLPQAQQSVEQTAEPLAWITIVRIMSLAILLILMLLAAPQLARGAERISLWLLPR